MNDSLNYQCCSRCVMDTTDTKITFDVQGVCNHCNNFDLFAKNNWFANEEGRGRLEVIIEKIKKDGKKKSYRSRDLALHIR